MKHWTDDDWMDQEILRQAAEAGDPAAQTTSWAIPVRRQGSPATTLWLVAGVLVLLAALAVLAASAIH
jgi:hypothetical protein